MTQTVLTLLPVSALLLISLSHGLGGSASPARGAVMAPQRDRPLITLTPQRIKLQVGSPPRTLTGQASLTLLEAYVREVFGLRKIVLEVLASNDGAIRLYLRHNYREVGRWQRHFRQGDDYADVVIMEKLLAS